MKCSKRSIVNFNFLDISYLKKISRFHLTELFSHSRSRLSFERKRGFVYFELKINVRITSSSGSLLSYYFSFSLNSKTIIMLNGQFHISRANKRCNVPFHY